MRTEINKSDDEPWERFDVCRGGKKGENNFLFFSPWPPASIVAFESVFSSGSRVLMRWRSRLTSKHLEIAVCLKD